MSLLNHIKRAFGLDIGFEADDSDFEQQNSKEPVSDTGVTANAGEQLPQDENLGADIFDGVIELFNKTQPEFVRECLETNAQKEYILRNIDSKLRSRLEKEVNRAKIRGQILWEEQMKKLDKEIEILRQEKDTLQHKRDESKSQQLSAERQKRALIERVHDLETQLLTIEAEKEQYVLENRSMLNKLRVVAVTGGDVSNEAVNEITDLESQLNEARKQIEALHIEAEHFKAMATAHIPVMEHLLKTIEELAGNLNEADQEKNSTEIDKISAELNKANDLIDSLNKKVEGLTSTQERDIREITELSERLKKKDAEIELLKQELDRYNSAVEPVESAETSVEPSPIAEIGETDKTPGKPASKTTSKPKKNKTAKKKPRISAIDELIENNDWFVAPTTLPESPKEPEKADDFGYKAPAPRKAHPDDDKQLSLW